ncbi:hypothetical protein P692DRAFT_201808031 [Suillus brevipes Sb2]|nr:hypothetical protein P692DRAFT_201808031 [Suillus brevipes Sb2]
MSDRREVYCQDFRQGGQACTCECFTPPSNHDAPYYCRECQHGLSKHPKALDPTRDASRRQDGTTSGKETCQHIQGKDQHCRNNKMCGTYKSEQLQFHRVTGKARATSQFDSEDKITKVAQWLLLVNCLDHYREEFQNMSICHGILNIKRWGMMKCFSTLMMLQVLRRQNQQPQHLQLLQSSNIIFYRDSLRHGEEDESEPCGKHRGIMEHLRLFYFVVDNAHWVEFK